MGEHAYSVENDLKSIFYADLKQQDLGVSRAITVSIKSPPY